MNDLPNPLVPPDADMRGLQFMPLDVVRLMDSDLFALSTGDEFKAAVSLWCKAWLQQPAGSLPDDDRVLAHLSGAGTRWKKVRAMALRGFVKCSDGRFYHPVVCEKVREAWEFRLRQRQRAAIGNAKRWGSRDASSGDRRGDPSCDPHGEAGAIARDRDRDRDRDPLKRPIQGKNRGSIYQDTNSADGNRGLGRSNPADSDEFMPTDPGPPKRRQFGGNGTRAGEIEQLARTIPEGDNRLPGAFLSDFDDDSFDCEVFQ